MYDTIIMIPGQMKYIFKPVAKWILGISIFRPINMQAQINANEQVTQIAKLVLFIGYNQKEYENECQYIFQ